jgi:hypothetical protein
MDSATALRLDSRKGNEHYNATFANNVSTTAKQYIESGLRVLNFYLTDFDAATDIVDMLQPVDGPNAFAKLDRNSALCWRHPAAFTQMHVMTTFLAQILFGGEQARSVEAQGEDDAKKADDVNALLAWNDAKIKIYLQGWLWIWNAVVYNRGVWYETHDQDVAVTRIPVEEDDISKPMVTMKGEDGKLIRGQDGKPKKFYQKRQRMRNKRVRSGFYNRLDLVSPYDFICDPAMPMTRFQEGRYAGHRVMIPWHELKRRSELEPSDDEYVLPHVVLKVKNAGVNAVTPSPLGATVGVNTSQTYYNRTVRGGGTTQGGIGGSGIGAGAGVDGVNKDDGGTVECFVLYIRAKPKTLRMNDDEEFEVIQLLTTSAGDVLSLNVQPNTHDEFPYSPAETCPSGQRQFTPGWGLKCKSVQDHIDDLNRTHTDAQKRMGNILLVDGTKCDVSNLLTPDKNGLMILRTETGRSATAEECVTQIPVKDTTENYPEEMEGWIKTMEDMTGANSYTQGQTEDPSQTLGQFDATKQMATGRISSIARLLSEQALCPQTRRFVMNFQQFGSDEQKIRIMGAGREYDPENPPSKFKVIKKTDIQGQYDVIPHDGSLPGADSKVVAAAARTIEAYAGNPALAQVFDVKIPGSIDPVKVARDLFKKSGLPIEKYAVSREEAEKNTRNAMQAAGLTGGAAVDPNAGASPPPAPLPPMIPTANGGIPSASELPASPSASPSRLNGLTT